MSPRPRNSAKCDRLSALPDDLLHYILRFSDARDAVGSLSLLSRRWRHLWRPCPASHPAWRRLERFGNLLLLLRDDAKLHTFCLRSTDNDHFEHERRWLRHVVSHGLRVLEFTVSKSEHLFHLPDCVFNCATLEEMVLSSTVGWEVIAPKSVCLPRLKKLHLKSMCFSGRSVVEKLNSGCPVLEDLDLSGCLLGLFRITSDTVKILSITRCEYEEIHVSAPNVVSLKLALWRKVKLDGMPSLQSAWVYVHDNGLNHLALGGYQLISALCNAQHLELFRFDLLLQTVEDIKEKQATEGITFSKLQSLYIGECLISDFYRPFTYFLNCAPKLANLTLDQWKLYKENEGMVSMGKKPSDKLNLVSSLSADLEFLRLRIWKGDDAGEFCKMQRLLKEKTKPKETEVVWFTF